MPKKSASKGKKPKVTCRDSTLSSTSSSSDSETVDLSVMAETAILQSLNLLHAKIDKMQEESKNLESIVLGDKTNNITGLVDKVDVFISSNEEIISQYKSLHDKHERMQSNFDYLVGVVERQSVQIESLMQKVDSQTARSMRKNVIISGLDEDETEDPKATVAKFFQDKMSITPNISVAHRLGENYPGRKFPRPMVTRCTSVDDKRVIFENVGSLKGQKNSKGGVFFISDQLPESMAEERKKISERIKQNKAKPSEEQLNMKVKGNKLYVNNVLQRPPVCRPEIDECINIDKEELAKMDKLKLVTGDLRKEGGSIFYSCAVKVSSMQDVRRAYKKAIMQDPRATHVILAYRFDHNGKTYSDYYDDGEHGGGFMVMKLITESQLNGMAVMTVRHYGGQHLGYKRFKHIQEAAKSALYNLHKS